MVMVLDFRPGVLGSNHGRSLYFCYVFIHLFLYHGLFHQNIKQKQKTLSEKKYTKAVLHTYVNVTRIEKKRMDMQFSSKFIRTVAR